MASPRIKVRFDADTRGLERGTKRAESAIGGMGKKALAAGAGFLSLGAGVAAAKKAVDTTRQLALSTAAVARVTGMDTREASRWAAVAKSRNIETKALNMGFITLSKSIRAAGDDTSKQAKLFDRLGVSQKAIKAGDTSRVLEQVADGLMRIESPARRAAIGQQLFGRSNQALAPLLAKGSAGLREQLALSDKYGTTLTKGQVTAALAAASAQREMNMAMDGLRVAFGVAVLPSLAQGIGSMATFINQVRTGEGVVGGLAHGLLEMGANFVTSRSAGVLLAGVVTMLASRMIILGGVFAAQKAAAFAVGVRSLASSLIAAATGARAFTVSMTAANIATWANPIAAAVGIVAALAVSLGALSNNNQRLATTADEARSALDRQLQAMRGVRDFELDSKDAHLRYRQAQLDVRDAVRQRSAAEEQFGRNSDQWRAANIRVKQAVIERTRAQRSANDTDREGKNRTRELRDANNNAVETTRKRISTTRAESRDVRTLIDFYRRHGKSTRDLAPLYDLLRKKQNETKDALDDYRSATRRVNGANDRMRGNIGDLGGAWGDFMGWFSDSVNGTLSKLGAKNLSFSIQRLSIGGGEKRATGGYLVGPSRRDVIPVLAGADEAIVTRHQQPEIQTALAYSASHGVVRHGSLEALFAGVTTPHYMATGGHVGAVGNAGGRYLTRKGRGYLAEKRAEYEASLNTGGSATGLVPQVRRALAFAKRHGWNGGVVSGFRSREKQAQLYNLYLQGKGNLAAPPGSSSHEKGEAVDVSATEAFAAAMASAPANARLFRRVAGEPWHFSVTGYARGGFVAAKKGKAPKKTAKSKVLKASAATSRKVASLMRKIELEDALAQAGVGPPPDQKARRVAIDRLLNGFLTRDDRVALLNARAATLDSPTDGPGGGDDQDLQAQLDQERTRLAVSRKSEAIARSALGVFRGAGDIGYGRNNIIIQTLVPDSPRALQLVGEAAAAGFGVQGSVQASKIQAAM